MPGNCNIEELTLLAQKGDRGAQNDLWHNVKAWACSVSMAYLPYVRSGGGVWSVDDLEQCAGLGVLEAVKTYDADKGGFLGWCSFYIKRQCRSMLGLAGRIRKEHYNAARLDEPIPGAEDLTMLDCIEDEDSTAAMEAAEDRACNNVLRDDLLNAMDRLPDQSRHMIHRYDLDGLTLREAAREMGVGIERGRQCRVNGLRALRRDYHLRKWYSPNYYRRKGLAAFKTTFSSVVEDEAIQHLDSERRIYNEF